MNLEPLNWGIVGCGRVAANHAWAAKEAGLRLKWACDLIGDRARHLSKDYGIQHVTQHAQDLESDDRLDVVSIATDHASHLSLANLFLNKKAILIEKPIGTPSQNFTAFIDRAEQNGCIVGVVSQHRFRPHVRQIMEAIHAGALGDIELVRARTLSARTDEYYASSNWRGKQAKEGGSALINQGYHALDTLLFIFGRPSVLTARTWTHRTHILETEEGFSCILRFADGIHAEVFGSTAGAAVWDVVIEIYGSRGHVIFDLNHPGSIRECAGVEFSLECVDCEPPPGMSYFGTCHREVVADLVDAVRNRRTPMVTARDANQTLETIANIYEAACKNSTERT